MKRIASPLHHCVLGAGIWMCQIPSHHIRIVCLPQTHAGRIVGIPTLLQMGNTPIPEGLHVPFPTQPMAPSLFTVSNGYPDFTLVIFLLFFIVLSSEDIPKHYNLVLLCMCVWTGDGGL